MPIWVAQPDGGMITHAAHSGGMTEYHEAFWVVVGSAAPVIALSATIALGQVLDVLGPRRPRPHKRSSWEKWKLALRSRLFWAYATAVVTYAINLGVFANSASSLAHERDDENTSLIVVLSVLSLAFVLIQVLLTAGGRYELRKGKDTAFR
jgi:hypothetical protein